MNGAQVRGWAGRDSSAFYCEIMPIVTSHVSTN